MAAKTGRKCKISSQRRDEHDSVQKTLNKREFEQKVAKIAKK